MVDKTILMLVACARNRSCTYIRKIVRLHRTNARAASIVRGAVIGKTDRRERLPRKGWKGRMADAYNGMPASWLRGATWRKSRYSNPNGSCVELAALPGGGIAVRNSRDPGGPALIYTPAEVTAFIDGVKDGQFDDLAG